MTYECPYTVLAKTVVTTIAVGEGRNTISDLLDS